MDALLKENDYVLATKFEDGHVRDRFAVGFVARFVDGGQRVLLKSDNNQLFSGHGFRRAEKITALEGKRLYEVFNNNDTQRDTSLWTYLNSLRHSNFSLPPPMHPFWEFGTSGECVE